MSQISQLDDLFDEALARLRTSIAAQAAAAAPTPDQELQRSRIAALEAENAALLDELERLRGKRDKDVAALDELIAQLKPLIEEA